MIVLFVILLLILMISTYYCVKFALVIIRIKDVLEESLEKIDDRHNKITEILEIPLFFDSPEVRRTLNEIKEVQEIILEISDSLTNAYNNNSKKDQNDRS